MHICVICKVLLSWFVVACVLRPSQELMVEGNLVACDPALLDVFSFGILLWAVSSREKPYEAIVRAKRMNLWKLREFISGDEGGRPEMGTKGEEYMPLKGAPPKLLDLMRECWSKRPRQRPQGFSEIKERLEGLLKAVRRGNHGAGAETYTTNPMSGSDSSGDGDGWVKGRLEGTGERISERISRSSVI